MREINVVKKFMERRHFIAQTIHAGYCSWLWFLLSYIFPLQKFGKPTVGWSVTFENV